MSSECKLLIACNDYISGQFQGSIDSVRFEFSSGFYVAVGCGPVIIREEGSVLVFGKDRLSINYTTREERVGSWYWNQYTVSGKDAKRLLRLLGRSKFCRLDEWTCSEKFETWWEKLRIFGKSKTRMRENAE